MSTYAILKPNLVMTDVEKIFITVAQNRGHKAYVFNARGVDFDAKIIKGRTLINGVVKDIDFEFPEIIQNRLAVKKEDKEIYLRLAELIPFTSNRIGTKHQVYEKMNKIEEFKPFLLEVININQVNDFLDYLLLHKKVIAKPGSSNQGKGIYSIEREGQSYKVKYLSEENSYNQDGIINFFEKKLKKGVGFNFSPFFVSETHLGQSTVFRMHITRGHSGKWQLIKIFPYVNLNSKTDITNGMQGALITTREQMFIEQYYPDSFEEINKKLKTLFEIFTNKFQKMYPWRLDSLGLDIGISQEGKIAIYEVNAGPGVGFMAYPVACAQVDYYEWLQENAVMPCQNNFLPIHLR